MKFSRNRAIWGKLTSGIYGFTSKRSLTCGTGCCEKESISIEENTLIDSEIVKHKYESIACILTESKLAERKNELQKEVFSKVKKTKEIEDGFTFSFPYDEKFLLNMMEYIITEKRCCPFFNFEIKLHQTNDIQLRITGPLDAKKMLEMFLVESRAK